MSTQVEELVARISLEGIDSFTGGIEIAILGLEQLASTAVDMGQKLFEGFVDFTKEAIEEAGKVQILSANLEGLAGSAEKAADILHVLRQEGQRGGRFNFDELLGITRMEAAAGLDPRHFTRFIEMLGNVGSRGGTLGDLQMAARIFERIRSGQAPTAPQLTHFGLGPTDLKDAGIDLKTGNVEENLKKFEDLITTRFGAAWEKSINTLPSKFATVVETWQHLLAEFGDGLAPLAGKIADAIGPFVEFLAHSGVIKDLATNLANTFDRLFGVGEGEGLQMLLAYVVATAERLPEILENIGNMIKNIFFWVATGWIDIFNHILHGTSVIYNFVKMPLEFILTAARRTFDDILSLAQHLGFFKDIVRDPSWREQVKLPEFHPRPLTGISDIFSRALDFLGGKSIGVDSIGKRASEIFSQFKKDTGIGAPPDPNSEPRFLRQEQKQDEANAKLGEIVRNTADMKDFKKYALGGGERGAAGITPAEFYGRRSGNTIRLDASNASDMMKQAFEALLLDWEQQKARSGIF